MSFFLFWILKYLSNEILCTDKWKILKLKSVMNIITAYFSYYINSWIKLSQQMCFKYFIYVKHSFKRTINICFLVYFSWLTVYLRHKVSKKFTYLIVLFVCFAFFNAIKHAMSISNSKIKMISCEKATK